MTAEILEFPPSNKTLDVKISMSCENCGSNSFYIECSIDKVFTKCTNCNNVEVFDNYE